MGVFKTADGRSLVGIGQQDGNDYRGFAGWRDCVIQLTASGATENSVKYLNAIKDYAIAHNAKGESIMPPNMSVWISNNGVTTAVQADDIAVDGANVTICGIKWNGTAWDYTDAGKGGGGGASSLADLSDVNIGSNPEPKSILLYDIYEDEWHDIAFGAAIREVTGNNDDIPGVLTIGDAADLHINTGIFLTGETAASVMALIQAAIANGQYSTELPASDVGQLLDAARVNISQNAPTYLNIDSSTGGLALSLLSGSSESSGSGGTAAWTGCYLGLTKVYRVTLFAALGEGATSGIVAVKAEELMTLDIG